MNIRELEYFVKIVEKENLTSAALELYVSQPTLSKYLDRLESEIGMPLFERINRTMKLTYAGERYLHYARKILALKHDLDLEMASIQKENRGILKVGIPTVRSSVLLPKVLPIFKKEYPKVDFQIFSANSQKIDEKIKDGSIDIAFYYLGTRESDFTYEILKKDRLYVVLSEDNPLNKKITKENSNGIYFDWLEDEKLLLQNRSTRHGQLVSSIIEGKKFKQVEVVEDNNILSAAVLAKNGYGITLISSAFANDFNCFPLLDCDASFNFVVAYRSNAMISDYARRFIEIVKEVY